ncbi:bifunctional UDP-N-acetylmuramoyl-tripeptide:D-alanyl-D-alanine ligase/alanine racemase [Halocola ammonii]
MSHLQYSLPGLKDELNGKLLSENADHSFDLISIDTRKMYLPAQSVFVALSGIHHNGHKFLAEAFEKGIRQFIVDDESETPKELLDRCTVLKVDNSLLALQKLAAHHRSQFDIPIIGITGSNGKTIVKEWINSLTTPEQNIIRSPRSFNSQVGVPLSVWNIEKHHTLGVFEAGISQPGEMDALRKMIDPTIGVLTNIGVAHLEHFDDQAQILKEKLRLFKNCKTLICAEMENVSIDSVRNSLEPSAKILRWSRTAKNADLFVAEEEVKTHASVFRLKWQQRVFECTLPFTDLAHRNNMLTALLTALQLGISVDELSKKTETLRPVGMRLELLDGPQGSFLINDTYSADLHSLEVALDFMLQQRTAQKRVLIVSDLLQSGLEPALLYYRLASLVEHKKVDEVYAIGPEISDYKDEFKCSIKCFRSTEDFLNDLNPSWFENSTVLIKGARSFHFEKIVHLLQARSHETIFEIDLNGMVHNLNFYREKLKPGVKLMAMVKAFAYGSGSYEVASLLEYHRVDYLSVAYADEGVELRKAGIQLPILVLNTERAALSSFFDYRLEPEIYNFATFQRFAEVSKNYPEEKIPGIHLKVETGMNRLGFTSADIGELCQLIRQNKHVKVKSVMSHLAASDDPQEDDFTKRQISEFDKFSAQIEEATGYQVLKHISNTGAITRFPEAQFDMVRLGIGLYGAPVAEEDEGKLAVVGRLKTVVSQVKTVLAGETIGYGRSFKAERDMQIAILAIGYADGLNRRLSNQKGEVSIKGRRCKIVGRVCMDMTMADVTGLDVKPGDEAEIFGDDISLEEIAQWLETIPYEVLTSVSQRVKRIYVQE